MVVEQPNLADTGCGGLKYRGHERPMLRFPYVTALTALSLRRILESFQEGVLVLFPPTFHAGRLLAA